jgi:hypothetical protein
MVSIKRSCTSFRPVIVSQRLVVVVVVLVDGGETGGIQRHDCKRAISARVNSSKTDSTDGWWSADAAQRCKGKPAASNMCAKCKMGACAVVSVAGGGSVACGMRCQ